MIYDQTGNAAVAVTDVGMYGTLVDTEVHWLYPFISWLCPRTEPQRKWGEKAIGAEKTFAIGGNNLWAFSTALQLLWLAAHEPQVLARTKKWLHGVIFLPHLSGSGCPVVDSRSRR